jgi:hypothetical protein
MASLQELIAQGYTPEQAASLMGKSGGNSAVLDAINATAARAGMDPKYWRAFATVESSLDPGSNANKATQYKGLFQIGTRGPDSEWARHGQGNVFDPMANARAAAELAAANNAGFKAHFGRDPTPAETYLMHQQGLGFYTKGAMKNIAGNLPDYARTPENMTHEGFERWWTDRLGRAANSPIAPGSPISVPRGGASTAGAVPAGATASTPTSPDATGDDFASKLAGVQETIAKQDEANAPPPLPPMQMAQPMMTPAMQRARLLAQTMLARDMGVQQ